jgi:hypothetical protein
MHCITYAFGKLGYTNVHLHENSVLLLYLSWLVMLLPLLAKGATMEPGASCVLQPHDCYQERARYLDCGNVTRHTDLSLPMIALAIANSSYG